MSSKYSFLLVPILMLSQAAFGQTVASSSDKLSFHAATEHCFSLHESLQGQVSVDAERPGQMTEIMQQDTASVEEADTPIIVSSDQAQTAANVESECSEGIDIEGQSCINAGSKFPICMSSSHTSKNAKVGDPVEASLAMDLKIGNKLVAERGSKILGHVFICKPARSLHSARVSRDHRLRAAGAIGLQLDEIISANGEHLVIDAVPARQDKIVQNNATGRILGVDKGGEIAMPISIQLKAQALHGSICLACGLVSVCGPIGMIAGVAAQPIACGALGALSPSSAFKHPVGSNIRHRRLKGFALGALSGLPFGGTLLVDCKINGAESVIYPGDQFLIELKQPFSGQTSADYLASETDYRVSGQINIDPTKHTDHQVSTNTSIADAKTDLTQDQ